MSYGRRGSSGTTCRAQRPSGPAGSAAATMAGAGQVVLRQVRQQCARRVERAGFVGRRDVRDAAAGRVGLGAAEVLAIHVLVGHGLHDVRTGDEHVARALDHDGEVGDGGRIDRATGTRPEDDRDLRHDSGRQDVAQEDVGVATQRHDTFLDPRATRIVEPDDRCTDFHRQVHDLADLLGVRLRQRSTEDREILAEDEDRPTIDETVSGDDAVAEEGFGRGRVAVRDERVQLDERSRVEQQVETFARGQLAGGVLLGHTCDATALARRGAHLLEEREPLRVGRHRSTLLIGLSLRKDSAIISGATWAPNGLGYPQIR